MTYKRFEDLPVWQDAARLYELSEGLIEESSFRVSRGFRDQLDRATLSVSNNIAEGFERGTTSELLYFIYIARGSAGEVRSMLTLKERRARRDGWPVGVVSRLSELRTLAECCSRQLRGWADSLQNSEIKGQRHLNDRTRRLSEDKARAAAVRQQLLRHLSPDHPLVKEAKERGGL